ncbi:hypothetical protein Bca52824_000025 [Brassica carinata]|uniref:Uncharacterized protein n=1 Tax=Brassica carinata TaxID=52824 RepID=A0A8X7WHC7_BRACI|nr:hypothetical protein Bca52824_000025 [Brassica carinata]
MGLNCHILGYSTGNVAARRTISLTGVSALSRDLLSFETTSQNPIAIHNFFFKNLKKLIMIEKYGKILEAWKQAKPRPQTDEEAARLVITTLKGHKKADLEGLLSFYRLPSPGKLDEILMNHLCL